MFPEASLIIAAISGGLDSMCLLHYLLWLREQRNVQVVVAHVNHGLRSETADRDENFIAAFAKAKQLPFYVKKIKVAALAKAKKIGIEEMGRIERLSFFQELYQKLGSQEKSIKAANIRIALAHHADDQAETIIMNLGRGSGLKGLCGMNALQLPYIRPFLTLRKSELMDFAEKEQIAYVNDESNQSSEYLRNRIRLQLLPQWQEQIGYDVIPLISRMGEHLSEVESYLSKVTDELYAKCSLMNKALNIEGLDQEAAVLVARVLQKFYLVRRGQSQNLNAAQIKMIQQLIQKNKTESRVYLNNEWSAFLFGELLFIEKNSEYDQLKNFQINLAELDFKKQKSEIGFSLPFYGGEIKISCLPLENEKIVGELVIQLESEELNQLLIRMRQAKDVLKNQKTLKKYYNEKKIPWAWRSRLPLVVEQGKIIFVPMVTANPEADGFSVALQAGNKYYKINWKPLLK